jgi:N-methylhydantoinase A
LYGRRPDGVELEIVSWRVRVSGPAPAVDVTARAGGNGEGRGTRPIWSPERGELVDATVIDRYVLRPGEVVVGPAVVEERESTAVIGVGGRGSIDEAGNLVVEIDG